MSSTTSSTSSAVSTAAAATSSAAVQTFQASKNLKIVGIVLAIVSGMLIGTSFVFKKKGLLRSQAGGVAGEGVGYLKSPMWWLGMSMMIVGELCNFAAYAFVEAIVVTPLGALSVVICAILSSIFLKETLTFFGWLGCGLCIIGSVIIALNGPQEPSVGQIKAFQKLFLAPGFLTYTSILIVAALVIIFYYGPKYGKKSMLWYILVCSMIGGISVSVTTGLGAAIVRTALGDNQFKYWFMYFLFIFVIVTLITEVYYLNVALALFNTAMVTPTYYVIFTFFSMLTTIILFQGLKASVTSIITLVMGFVVICFGITILQMSKIDPTTLSTTTKLDRRSTLLLQASRQKTGTLEEKSNLTAYEDPGIDALRGSFGTFGSIIRARSARRMSQSSGRTGSQLRPSGAMQPFDRQPSLQNTESRMHDTLNGMKRHQLYDAPVPRSDLNSIVSTNRTPSPSGKRATATIKFDTQDVVYKYDIPGSGEKHTTERRVAVASPSVGYPPLPSVPPRTEGLPPSSSHRNIDLLGITEEPESNSATDGNTRHSLEIPTSRILQDNKVQSAPPALHQRFAAMMSGSTTTLLDKTASTASLLSFPSVTDSGPSENWEEDPEVHARRQREWEVERAKTKELDRVREQGERDRDRGRGREKSRERERERDRTRSGKRYPGASEDDDREESISLWDRSRLDDDDSVEGTSPQDHSPGGIRLVQPKRPDMF